MVLCSIAVHGLSIPFFTFGRRVHSVSRTWSRHDTMGSTTRRRSILPEWATQIHHVQPGEAIVINRDRQAETLTPMDGSSTQEEKPVDEEPQTPHEKVTPPGSEQALDGAGIVSEWREGPHRVIERREGPGAEVSFNCQFSVLRIRARFMGYARRHFTNR